jgi:hypothetical protein
MSSDTCRGCGGKNGDHLGDCPAKGAVGGA